MSGRPDPSWTLSPEARDNVVVTWESLSTTRVVAPRPPPLGYRGCMVTGRDERWLAYAGIVQRTRGTDTQTRKDDSRSIERALIDSAPDPALRQMLIDIARGGSRW